MDFTRFMTAILLPPFGVYRQAGFKRAFWLNLLLTASGYIPGIAHALWMISDEGDSATRHAAARNLWFAGS